MALMNLKNWKDGALAELLTGRIHHPKPGDPCYALGERFRGKALVLAMVAKDRAATLPVFFDGEGRARLGVGRQFLLESGAELSRGLKELAASCGASWVLGIQAMGWRCELGLRSSRGAEAGTTFAMLRLGLEHPELFVRQVRPDWLYVPVDHPLLDRSLVFSCRRKDLDLIVEATREAGLGLAGLRLGVASQIEAWFAVAGAEALTRDLLVTDGMSVLLLQVRKGDFVVPRSEDAPETEALPRQASSRPKDLLQDLVRFAGDKEGGPLRFLGPPEYLDPLCQGCPERDITLAGAGGEIALDAARAALSTAVRHDLAPREKPERAPLSLSWRPWLRAAVFALLLCLVTTLAGLYLLGSYSAGLSAGETQLAALQQRQAAVQGTRKAKEKERLRAQELQEWLASGYHAQVFYCELLGVVPEDVVMERLAARLDEGSAQLSLEFSLLGRAEAQVRAMRAMENKILGRGIRVGERTQLGASGSGACAQRWRLILDGGAGGFQP